MIKLARAACPNPIQLKSNYKFPANKVALKESCNNKCMYCESEFDSTDYGDVEHIKPKSLFPALEFEWDNLGYSCVKCNRENKNDEWDVALINPFVDDPSDYMVAIGAILWPKNLSTRGQVSIDIIGLNRIQLIMKRSQRLVDLGQLISRYNCMQDGAQKRAIRNQILTEMQPSIEFSFAKKAFVDQVLC